MSKAKKVHHRDTEGTEEGKGGGAVELSLLGWLSRASADGWFGRNLKAVTRAYTASWSRRAPKRAVIVFIHGPGGSGKATLQEWFYRMLPDNGERVTVHVLQGPIEGPLQRRDTTEYLHIRLQRERRGNLIDLALVAQNRRLAMAINMDIAGLRSLRRKSRTAKGAGGER